MNVAILVVGTNKVHMPGLNLAYEMRRHELSQDAELLQECFDITSVGQYFCLRHT
jgi:hypothetical protein